MKYPSKVYEDFGAFFAQATEIGKDKISLYNYLLDPPVRKRTNSSGFTKFLEFIIYVLQTLGWYVFIAIAGLVGLGAIGYFGGMGTLVASNPILAAAVAIMGGGSIYLIWKNRQFLLAQKVIGERYKNEFDLILKQHPVIEENRVIKIERLMKQCVVSLCVEAFQINSDEAKEKIENDI
jgi:hypothetical protein